LVPDRRRSAVAGDEGRGAGGWPGATAASRITVHAAATEQAEAAWIAKAIDRLLGGASFHSLDTGRADGHAGGKLALADMAVLYRTDAQAVALGQALTRAGLPFQKRSHDLLGRRAAVPEILREMGGAAGQGLAGPGLIGRGLAGLGVTGLSAGGLGGLGLTAGGLEGRSLSAGGTAV